MFLAVFELLLTFLIESLRRPFFSSNDVQQPFLYTQKNLICLGLNTTSSNQFCQEIFCFTIKFNCIQKFICTYLGLNRSGPYTVVESHIEYNYVWVPDFGKTASFEMAIFQNVAEDIQILEIFLEV